MAILVLFASNNGKSEGICKSFVGSANLIKFGCLDLGHDLGRYCGRMRDD